jgi:hypothetical protein
MVFDSAAGIAGDPVEHFDDGSDFDGKTGFFPHFASDRGLERLPDFDAAARQAPLAFERFVPAFDQQYAIAVEYDSPDTNDRTVRIGLHELPPR